MLEVKIQTNWHHTRKYRVIKDLKLEKAGGADRMGKKN